MHHKNADVLSHLTGLQHVVETNDTNAIISHVQALTDIFNNQIYHVKATLKPRLSQIYELIMHVFQLNQNDINNIQSDIHTIKMYGGRKYARRY